MGITAGLITTGIRGMAATTVGMTMIATGAATIMGHAAAATGVVDIMVAGGKNRIIR